MLYAVCSLALKSQNMKINCELRQLKNTQIIIPMFTAIREKPAEFASLVFYRLPIQQVHTQPSYLPQMYIA